MSIQTKTGAVYFLAVESYPVVSVCPAYEVEGLPESQVTLDLGGGKTLTQSLPIRCDELIMLLGEHLEKKPSQSD